MFYFALSAIYKRNPNPSPIGIRFGLFLFGAPSGTRTRDPLIKRQKDGALKNTVNTVFYSNYPAPQRYNNRKNNAR